MTEDHVRAEFHRALFEAFERILEHPDGAKALLGFIDGRVSFVVRRDEVKVVPHGDLDQTPLPGQYL